MNKVELIEQISAISGLSKVDAKKALEATVEAVTETMTAGNKLTLVGFGSLETRERGARAGRNPKTGESLAIKAKTVVKFKAGRDLLQRIQKAK